MRAWSLVFLFVSLAGAGKAEDRQWDELDLEFAQKGNALLQDGKIDQARDIFTAGAARAAAVGRKDIEARMQAAIGVTYLDEKDNTNANDEFEKADQECQELLKANPSLAKAHFVIGKIYYSKNDYAKAAQEFKVASECDPNFVDAHVELGRLYFVKQHDFPKAAQKFEKALIVNPKLDNVHAMLGRIYSKLGRYDDALRELKLGINYVPYKWITLATMAEIYNLARFNGKHAKDALAALDEAETLKPKDEYIYAVRGSTLVWLDRMADAEAAFKNSLSIRPNEEAYIGYGGLLANDKRYPEALANLREAEKLDPEEKEISDRIVRVLEKQGDYKGILEQDLKKLDFPPL